MKRTLVLSLSLALFAPLALVGCGEEAKDKTTVESKGPGGSTKVEKTEKTTTSGDGGPAAGGATK